MTLSAGPGESGLTHGCQLPRPAGQLGGPHAYGGQGPLLYGHGDCGSLCYLTKLHFPALLHLFRQ